MALKKIFGDSLLTKSGEQPTETVLSGKAAIGIYFSAHWCPPCRGFTPKLADMYNDAFQALDMEVVFVSSDRDDASFNSYYADMPWVALPFAQRDIKAALSKKYKVQGIPSLVIIDAKGQTITTDGRSAVIKDPEGTNFPWKPKPFSEIIGKRFLKGDAEVGAEAFAGKTLAIYFSAHWCPPCRGFTPILAKHYKNYTDAGKPIEVIFSTADQSKEEFENYRKEMQNEGGTWLSIPYEDKETREGLDSLFKVEGIPKLVIVGEDGSIINDNAVGEVRGDVIGEKFPWAPPAVGDLARPEGIEDAPSVCVFLEEADAERRQVIQAQVEEVANMYVAQGKANAEDPKYRFYVASVNQGAVPHLRRMSSMAPVAPKSDTPKLQKRGSMETMDNPEAKSLAAGDLHVPMLLMDLMDDGAFYTFEGPEITAATITTFLEGYEKKTLKRQQLQKS